MVRWFAGLAALLLILTASAFAQPFAAQWIYAPDGGNAALTTVCPAQGGTVPIPDGRIVKIFWDSNNNGPDATDPQPAVCLDPPDCSLGPSGSVNFNQFVMNGTAMGLGVGYFATESYFASVDYMPTPPIYYLRVYEPDGVNYLWTSRTFTLNSGPQEVVIQRADWTCGSGGPQCVVRDEHE